jgi:hypothetical protein
MINHDTYSRKSDNNKNYMLVVGLFSFALTLFSIFLIHLLLISAAEAKGRGLTIEPAQMIISLKERCNLTDEQVEQIRPILENSKTKQQEIFEEMRALGRQGKLQFRQEMLTIADNTEKELSLILTTEQIDEYRKFQAEQHASRRNNTRSRSF